MSIKNDPKWHMAIQPIDATHLDEIQGGYAVVIGVIAGGAAVLAGMSVGSIAATPDDQVYLIPRACVVQ